MSEKDFDRIICMALERMNRHYVDFSKIYYSEVNEDIRELAMKSKYLERPFAYEFYHALRELIEQEKVNIGGRVIQAEVDKRYQHYFSTGVIPDFIIHEPNNTKRNFAVIEFKLASNTSELKKDFRKFEGFKSFLNYENAIEIIIGDSDEIRKATGTIKEITTKEGEEITIILFNTDSWKATYFTINYLSFIKIKYFGIT
jgi:hypothetical protein